MSNSLKETQATGRIPQKKKLYRNQIQTVEEGTKENGTEKANTDREQKTTVSCIEIKHKQQKRANSKKGTNTGKTQGEERRKQFEILRGRGNEEEWKGKSKWERKQTKKITEKTENHKWQL